MRWVYHIAYGGRGCVDWFRLDWVGCKSNQRKKAAHLVLLVSCQKPQPDKPGQESERLRMKHGGAMGRYVCI